MDKPLSDSEFTRIWALAMTLITDREMELDRGNLDTMVREAFGSAVELYGDFKADLMEDPIATETALGARIEFWMTPEGQLTLTLPD